MGAEAHMVDGDDAQAHAGDSTPTCTIPSDPTSTPTHPTYFALVSDALTAHPGGLRSQEIINWLEANRPEAFQDRSKDKIKISIQTTLSAQANRKIPRIRRYRDEGSKGSGYIWTLSSVAGEAERALVNHSAFTASPTDQPMIDESRPDRDIHTPSFPGISEGHSKETRGPSAASTLLLRSLTHDPKPATEPATDFTSSIYPDRSVADNEGEQAQTMRLPCSEATPGPAMQTPLNGDQLNVITLAEKTFVSPENVEIITSRASEETGITSTSNTVTLESCSEQYFGSLVSKIHFIRRQRETVKQEIQSKCDSINQADDVKRRASDLQRHAEDLERQAQQAREQAVAARKDMERACAEQVQHEADIASANQRLEQLASEEKEARESLGID